MGKKGRHRRAGSGRVTPKGTRPHGFQPAVRSMGGPLDRAPGDGPDDDWFVDDPFDDAGYHDHDDDEPDLVVRARQALADDHPMTLLAEASSLLAALDRQDDLFADLSSTTPHELPQVSRDQILMSFVDSGLVETAALAEVIATLTPDNVERRRVRRALAQPRAVPSLESNRDRITRPAWLAALDPPDVVRAMQMTDALGDGDNIMIDVRLPSGHAMTAVLYVDFNAGTAAKDGYTVEGPLDELIELMRTKIGVDPDMTWAGLDLADARARCEEAIDTGARMYPPFETESWPQARPLIQWILRSMPPGGTGFEHAEWDEDRRAELARRFLASPFMADVGLADNPETADLVDSLLWYGCDYGKCDPLRWSPVSVEILLADWLPRKIVADVDYLAKFPEVLRRLVRFGHAELGMRAALTEATVAAVDRWEPAYQRVIRSPRPQGPAALLAAIGVPVDVDGGDVPLAGERDWRAEAARFRHERLVSAVGGETALAALDDTPLPDEPLGLDAVASDVRDRVATIGSMVDRCCDELFGGDRELRTACRRFLALAAAGDPALFRRRSSDEKLAAGVCWVVGRANGAFDERQGGTVEVGQMMAWFGLKGSASDRGLALLAASALDGGWLQGEIAVGTPGLLVSSKRQALMRQRDNPLSW